MNDEQYDAARCVIGDKPHRATYGYLCTNHFERLGAMLRDIEDEAIQLEIRPSMAISYDDAGGSGLASEQSPIRLVPAVLKDSRRGTGMTTASEWDELAWDDTPSAMETLHSRARTVREERNLTLPTSTVLLGREKRPDGLHGPVCVALCGHDSCGPWVTDTVRAKVTLTGERDLLTRQLPWIAEQPWVDEFYSELSGLLASLQRANHTLELSVGRCDTLQLDGELCDGKVWHVLIKADGTIEQRHNVSVGPDDEPGFRCAKCRRVWTGTNAVRKRYAMWLDEQEGQAS